MFIVYVDQYVTVFIIILHALIVSPHIVLTQYKSIQLILIRIVTFIVDADEGLLITYITT